MLYGLILVVHIFVCLILIAVILLQAGRGGGLADVFGGGMQSIFGTRGAQVLTRATTICAAIFMLTSLSLAVLSVQRGRSLLERLPREPVTQPVASPTAQPPSEPAVQPAAERPAQTETESTALPASFKESPP